MNKRINNIPLPSFAFPENLYSSVKTSLSSPTSRKPFLLSKADEETQELGGCPTLHPAHTHTILSATMPNSVRNDQPSKALRGNRQGQSFMARSEMVSLKGKSKSGSLIRFSPSGAQYTSLSIPLKIFFHLPPSTHIPSAHLSHSPCLEEEFFLFLWTTGSQKGIVGLWSSRFPSSAILLIQWLSKLNAYTCRSPGPRSWKPAIQLVP